MAEMAKFRKTEDDLEKYGRPGVNQALVPPPVGNLTGGVRSAAQMPSAAPGEGREPWEVDVPGRGGFGATAKQIADRLLPEISYQGKTVLGGKTLFGAREASAAAPPITPMAGVRQAAAAEFRPVEAPDLMTSDRNDTSYRIMRRRGQSPILTNVADPISEAARGENYAETEDGRTDFFGGVPESIPGLRAPSALEAAPAPTANVPQGRGIRQPKTTGDYLQGMSPGSGPGAIFALNAASRLSATDTALANREENLDARGIRQAQRDRRLGIDETLAGAQQANAGINAIKTQAELARLNKDLGVNLKPIFEETLIDPAQPYLGTVKTITGFASEDGNVPVNISIKDYRAYQRARMAAATPEERELIERSFREEFQLGD